MQLYAITNRRLLSGTETERREKLPELALKWARSGVRYIQIREKDLSRDELAEVAAEVVRAVRESRTGAKVLLNAGSEIGITVALRVGADGIHLPGGLSSNELAAAARDARKDMGSQASISVSCHSVAEILDARTAGVSLALFAPVFEKVLPDEPAVTGSGLKILAEACLSAQQPSDAPELPIFALGGVTQENASLCVEAGAAGIAAIRLFSSAEGMAWVTGSNSRR